VSVEQNVGGYDRIARLLAGPLLLAVGLASLAELLPLSIPVGVVATVIGLVFVLTGTTQFCILNSLLGIDTSQ
jgi:hypothetical protein